MIDVDLASAPTGKTRRRTPCSLTVWLSQVRDDKQEAVRDIIYGTSEASEVGRWLMSQEGSPAGDLPQMIRRHRNNTCTYCREASQ